MALTKRCWCLTVLTMGLAAASAGLCQPPGAQEAPSAEQFTSRLQSHSRLERLAAARELLETGAAERFLPQLQQGLRDPDTAVRMVSAVALGTAPTAKEDTASALIGALEDKQANVRMYAARALGCMQVGAQANTEALSARRNDPDAGVRNAVTWALEQITASQTGRQGARSGGAVPGGARPGEEAAEGAESGGAGARQPAKRTGGGGGDAQGAQKPPRETTTTAPAGSVQGLIAQLTAPNADTRLQAAEALGKIGPPAKAAIPALEKACQDPDERVRRKAWWALSQIRRPTNTGGQQEPPEPVEPAAGRLFFLPACQDVTPGGIVPRKPEGGESDDHTAYLFGLTDLYWVDVAAATAYRQDAKRRGLESTGSLMDMLMSDPGGEQYLSTHPVLGVYEKDHVIAIACNRQLRFMYKRYDSEGQEHRHGGDFHMAMSNGPHVARAEIFSSEGFRLQYQIEFDFATGVDNDQQEISELKQYNTPGDVATDLRQMVADDADLTAQDRARLCLEIANSLTYTAKRLIWARSYRADAAAPYAYEALAFMKMAKRFDDNVNLHTTHANDLLQLCAMLNTQEGYSIGLTVIRMVQDSLSGVSLTSTKAQDRTGWIVLATCRRMLGNIAIAYRNDVDLFWHHAEEYLKYAGDMRHPVSGEKIRDIGPDKERDTWPQRGWWRDEWNSLRPDDLLHQQVDDDGEEQKPPDPQDRRRKLLAKLKEALQELDEQRAQETRWLHSVRKAFMAAERRKALVRGMLRVQAGAAQKIRHRIAQLRKILAEAPKTEGTTHLENFFKFLMDKWDDAWGPPPGPDQDVVRIIKQQIADLSQQHEQILREQDALIKDTVETYYQSIILEVEAKGDKSLWEDVRKVSQLIKRDAGEMLALAKAELYLASGQGGKFKVAAQGAIADGKYEAQVRLMQALHYHSNNQFRHAMAMYRQVMQLTAPKDSEKPAPLTREQAQITGDEKSMYQRARKMVWTLEHAYLNAIDEKASGEAAQVRAKSAERLKKGGEEGWFEWLKGHLKMGVVSATSAVVGREDALEGLASKYQKDVAAQHCGLLLAKSLHERGVPLGKIDGLTNAEFIALVKSKFTGVKSELTPEQALRMRAAVKAAYQNPDMARLAAGPKQMLNVDTGTPYFNSDAYNETALEWWGDIVNVWNVATMLGPMSTFKVAGKVQTTPYWGLIGEGRQAGAIVTAKEAFARGIGLPKLAAAIGKTRAGQFMTNQFTKFFEKSTWLQDRALDATIQISACKLGEATGGTIGVVMGSDGKAEAEAGRMFAELFTAWGAGDVDVMKSIMASNHIAPKHLKGLIQAAEQIADTSGDAAAVAGKHLNTMKRVLPEVSEGGLSSGSKRLVRQSIGEIKKDLADAARKFQAGDGTPELCRKVDSLKVAYEGLAAAEGGMAGQARTWQDILQEAADGANVEARAAARQAGNLKKVSQQLEAAGGGGTAKTGALRAGSGSKTGVKTGQMAPDRLPANLKNGSILARDVDELVLEGNYQKAIALYERRLALLKQFNLGETVEAKDIALKLRQTRKIWAAEYRLNVANDAPDMQHSRAIDPGEIEAMDADPERYVKVRMATSDAEATYSDPYWVWEVKGDRAVKVGVFKGSGAGFTDGYDLRAEVLYYKIAKAIDLDVPACKIGTMTVNGKKVKGLFVRVAPGASLESYDNATHIALKKKLARDKALATLLGDHDRRPANYLVAGKGHVTSIDHGMSDPCGRVYSEAAQFADEDITNLAIEQRIVKEGRIRQGLDYLDEHITIEDMAPTIDKLKVLFQNETKVKQLLESALSPKEVQQAMTVLKRRLSVMETKLTELYGTRAGMSAAGSGIEVRPGPEASWPAQGRRIGLLRTMHRSHHNTPLEVGIAA